MKTGSFIKNNIVENIWNSILRLLILLFLFTKNKIDVV